MDDDQKYKTQRKIKQKKIPFNELKQQEILNAETKLYSMPLNDLTKLTERKNRIRFFKKFPHINDTDTQNNLIVPIIQNFRITMVINEYGFWESLLKPNYGFYVKDINKLALVCKSINSNIRPIVLPFSGSYRLGEITKNIDMSEVFSCIQCKKKMIFDSISLNIYQNRKCADCSNEDKKKNIVHGVKPGQYKALSYIDCSDCGGQFFLSRDYLGTYPKCRICRCWH
jgi:hypothetical protein